ncbi:MAG: nucleotide exchange factor GrpE [Deltaproteobacteria bacterium]|nr:nucleotide exchange factor GrpE [Deltaproteobacteria bacterium]
MSGDKDKFEQLFQEAVAGQERLQTDGGTSPAADDSPTPAAPAAAAAVASEPAADDSTTAPAGTGGDGEKPAAGDGETVAAGDGKPAAAPARKSAAEALTEALIKAKQEAVQALEQTQLEAKSLHDRLLRVSADFDNFRKRSKKQTDDAVTFANEALLRELLPSLDAFDRALEAIGTDENSALAQGIQMVRRVFSQGFQRVGLQPFDSIGTAFDPNRHEAVEQVITTEHLAGSIVREYQKGYLFHERLLRPATVAVAMAPAPPAEPPAEQPTKQAAAAQQPAASDPPAPAASAEPTAEPDAAAGPDTAADKEPPG